ncbi:hypothetical protein NK214_10855 [Chromobacterium sp. S0633]|uniref:hypothetical protein n=1 Tax=unclassified Chromobacterium TaxID=2641838 RepID=UPI000D31346D|nr:MULTISPECIES: hypothetical protein [unclassified Chromobacterium]MCP1290689.1 hypothetical protein [Chromobacterium sp. S0633]PTU65589.1 hypothetical protein DB032_11900 [Chromobacterium sp. Panama]
MRLSAFKSITRLALLLFMLWQALPLANAAVHTDGALGRAGPSYALGHGTAAAQAVSGGHAHCAAELGGCGECQTLPGMSPAMATHAARPGWPDFIAALPSPPPPNPPRRPPRV